MTYKWTIPEVDDVELPMLFCLLEEMHDIMPADIMANAQMKAEQRKLHREGQSMLSEIGTVKGKVRRPPDHGN